MSESKLKPMTVTGVLLAIILAFQAVKLPQLATGTIINCVLFLSIFISGFKYGIILAVLSPVAAFITGIMPGIWWPLLPIIAIGNFLFVVFHWLLKIRHKAVRFIGPALIKALFIGSVGAFAAEFTVVPPGMKFVFAAVLGLQFITALAGTLVGFYSLEKVYYGRKA